MPMLAQVQAMFALASDVAIGLVVRWDADDALAWTMWSLPAGGVVTRDTTPVDIRPFVRTRHDAAPGGAGFVDTPIGQSYAVGLHAEEVMMLSWENLLAAARAIHGAAYNPRSVEVVLSKSPCHGESGSHLLAVNFSDGTLNMNVAGCSRKLAMFINDARTATVAQWKFYYFELAGARAAATDQVKLAASVAVVNARAAVETEVAARTPALTARYGRVPDPGTRRGLIERDVRQYRTQRETHHRVSDLEREMRLASVAQAQAGIHVLQSIRKVDVSRIVLNPVAGSSATPWPF